MLRVFTKTRMRETGEIGGDVLVSARRPYSRSTEQAFHPDG